GGADDGDDKGEQGERKAQQPPERSALAAHLASSSSLPPFYSFLLPTPTTKRMISFSFAYQERSEGSWELEMGAKRGSGREKTVASGKKEKAQRADDEGARKERKKQNHK
ncbi:hypothetical protein BHM03_00062192, partial [Ensete ventricosum]